MESDHGLQSLILWESWYNPEYLSCRVASVKFQILLLFENLYSTVMIIFSFQIISSYLFVSTLPEVPCLI